MKKHIIFAMLAMFPLFGSSQQLSELDEIAPFSEALAAVRRGGEWGFINEQGTLVIDFRDDLVWNAGADTSELGIAGIASPTFRGGRCLVKKTLDGIPLYGFIDTEGKLVIEHQFLNVTPFSDGYATGIIFEKVFRGKMSLN